MAEKVKLSTTGKKVVNLINQTVSDIYNDAVQRKNETWFGTYEKADGTFVPGYTNAKPVPAIIFKNKIADEANNIIKQMSGNLSAEDEASIQQATGILLEQVGDSYGRFANSNGTRYGFTQDTRYDSDPYSQQVGTQRVGSRTYPTYASFIDGSRMGTNVSGYAGTNNTYSMCDIVCTIDIAANTASNLSEHVVTTLGKLQTLSYSIYQQKQPVRCLGNMNAKDYVYGQRTIAGSLVFAVFNRHWLVDIYDQLINKGMMKNWHYIADEIPPFDITISFANEYGYDSKMALYGVRLMTEGQVMSINDIYIENTYQFVATDIEYLDSLNAWQRTDKIAQRWKNARQGTIAPGQKDEKGTDPVPNLPGKPIQDTPEEKEKEPELQILTLSEDILQGSTEKEMLEQLRKAYERQQEAFQEELKKAEAANNKEAAAANKNAMQQLTKANARQYQEIKAYYAKAKVEKAKQ